MDIRFGICNFCVPGGGVFAPRIVSELGLDGMSIEFGTYAAGWPLSQRHLQDLYLEAQQRYGIAYPNIGVSDCDNVPLHARPGTKWEPVIKDAGRKAIDAAAYMGIPLVFFCNFLDSEVKTEEDLEYIVRAYRYFCDYAGERDVRVACETPAGATEQRELSDRVDRENFSILHDSGNHTGLTEHDSYEVLTEIYDLIADQMHVKDGRPGENGSCIMGTGACRFPESAALLKKKGYSGWLILENEYDHEPMRHLNEVYLDILKEDIRALRAFFSK